MEKLDKHDIQGLVARGYGDLACARFLLLEIEDPARARTYLQQLLPVNDDRHKVTITDATVAPDHHALHVAFTRYGLEKLGLPETALASFAREFLEGMDDPVRSVSLGDQGDNDPKHWRWGRAKSRERARSEPTVDMVVLTYADDETTLDADEAAVIESRGFRVVATKRTRQLIEQKEHFGWKDGLSIPTMEGLSGKAPPATSTTASLPSTSWTFPFRAGEFVLGYKNEYEAYTESPTVDRVDDPEDLLPATRDGSSKDLGRNGTYLVYREMTQDVLKFWDYLATESREPGTDTVAQAIALGAKMVGRWPGGAPLIASPDVDDPAKSVENDFTFYDRDRGGAVCPLGSHIRRANPRDHLPSDHDRPDSVEMVRKHQMIRRGRAFGEPVVASMDPREVLAKRGQPDPEERGLHFICLVGHISRQFEFVQRAWINAPNFAAMYKDSDPLIGVHRPPPDPNASDEFTCPANPKKPGELVRRKYKHIPQFTRLVGGAYFFLPGIRALRFIAQHR